MKSVADGGRCFGPEVRRILLSRREGTLAQDLTSLLEELVRSGDRACLVIDERRFPMEGEGVLFAGVRVRARDLLEFAVGVERVRDGFDEQKKARALKSADVLSGRGRWRAHLTALCETLFQRSSCEYWATTTRYLRQEHHSRKGPAATVVEGSAAGRDVNGHETPVIEMMAGMVAEELGERQLDVFIDRSKQNGLYEPDPQSLVIYDRLDRGAAALQSGQPVVLGAGTSVRYWPVSEKTHILGDFLIPADLAAHLWGLVPECQQRLTSPRLAVGIERLGTLPGAVLANELRRHASRA